MRECRNDHRWVRLTRWGVAIASALSHQLLSIVCDLFQLFQLRLVDLFQLSRMRRTSSHCFLVVATASAPPPTLLCVYGHCPSTEVGCRFNPETVLYSTA